MRASRTLGTLAGSTAIALSVLLFAAPASAATLPEGQRITVAANSAELDPPSTTQLFQVDPATAAGTAVGGPDAAANPIYAIDVDNDGHGYATGTVAVDDETHFATLWTVDANTGTFSSPVTLEIPSFGSEMLCPAIDYTAGRILITCNLEGDDFFATLLGMVDPATGDVFVIIGIEAENETFTEFTALATSPTGVLWAFGYDEVAPFAAIVDIENESLGDRLPIVDNGGDPIDGADFDRDGQLFASVRVDDVGPALAMVDLGTGSVSVVGAYPFFELTGGVFAITVWGNPPPALAATGTASALPVALGSALLLLAGAAFFATARINRRVA